MAVEAAPFITTNSRPQRRLELKSQRSALDQIKDKVRDIPICLISPDSEFLLDSRVFPFLGILKVAGELERNGNPVFHLDLAGYRNQEDVLTEFMDRHPIVNTFGITATTPQIPAAVRIRNAIKAILPDSRVILGGPHATLTYDGVKTNPHGRAVSAQARLEAIFDKLVVGDGELAVFPAIDPDNTDKIIDATSMRYSPLHLQNGELEEFAPPARHMIDHDSYKFYIEDGGKQYRSFSVIGQLGCPFECIFCSGRNSDTLRLPRVRNVDSVISEIEDVFRSSERYAEPFLGVMFYDDELNAVKGMLEGLCGGLIDMQNRLGYKIRARGFVKADLFNFEQANLMYDAGFRMLLTGVESGSDKILKAIRKRTSRAINSDCVAIAHEAGLKVKALMSIGHPGESRQTVEQSVEWVLGNLRVGDDVDWTIITQFPGAPIYDKSIYVSEADAWLFTTKIKTPQGEEVLRLWSRDVDFITESEFYKGIPGNYTAYVWTDHLSKQQLVTMRDWAEDATRSALKLPKLQSVTALQYDHSMGQGLPSHILRQSQFIASLAHPR